MMNCETQKIVEANIKLVDKNKLIISYINVLLDYISGDDEKKEELQIQVDNIFKIYKK